MKRTGIHESAQPKAIPKFTATRNGKAINQTVANVNAEDVLAQPEPGLNLLKWLNNWPKEPPKWNSVSEHHYKLTLDGVRMEVFSQQRDHTNKPIFGFSLFGVWGQLHTVPLLSFDLKETQKAAIDCIDWINNGQKTKAPYTIDPGLVTTQDEAPPRPRPVRPPVIGPPPRPRHPPIGGRETAPGQITILPAILPDGSQRQWFNEFFQTDVLRPGDADDYPAEARRRRRLPRLLDDMEFDDDGNAEQEDDA